MVESITCVPSFPPLTSSSPPYSSPQAFTTLLKLLNHICYRSNYAVGKTAGRFQEGLQMLSPLMIINRISTFKQRLGGCTLKIGAVKMPKPDHLLKPTMEGALKGETNKKMK